LWLHAGFLLTAVSDTQSSCSPASVQLWLHAGLLLTAVSDTHSTRVHLLLFSCGFNSGVGGARVSSLTRIQNFDNVRNSDGSFVSELMSVTNKDLRHILIIKPTRCTNFSNLFFGIELYMFRPVPLSIIRSTHSNRYM
jgi:hypothetical protein